MCGRGFVASDQHFGTHRKHADRPVANRPHELVSDDLVPTLSFSPLWYFVSRPRGIEVMLAMLVGNRICRRDSSYLQPPARRPLE